MSGLETSCTLLLDI